MRRSWSLAVLLAAAPLVSQQPASQKPDVEPAEARAESRPSTRPESPPDLESVLADLGRAHGGDEATRSAQSFQGKLAITPTAKTADKITVVLDVRFEAPDLIRYMVDEGERRLERGRDEEGPWARLDKEPISLTSRDYKGDREELEKHIALARQLLRYLDPVRVARGLENPVVAEQDLVINARKKIPCVTITGVAESFPLYFRGGETSAAQLQLWIDAKTHLLTCVEAFPLDAQGRPAPVGEFIFMPQHGDDNDIKLPVVMLFDRLVPGGHEPAAKVEIQQLELNPKLDGEKFSRNEPW